MGKDRQTYDESHLDMVEEGLLAAQDRFIGQLHLTGIWTSYNEGCPHMIKLDPVNRCTANKCEVCRYELSQSCEIFREILEEWKTEYERSHRDEPGNFSKTVCPA